MISRAVLPLLALTAVVMAQRSAICDRGDGLHAHPSQPCSTDYFDCLDGEATTLTCAVGLVFDAEVGSCAARPPACDFDCTTDGDFPTAECSNDYVTCTNGRAINQHCQAGLVYDEAAKACDRREHIVACGGRPTQATPTLPPVACTGPDGVRPHPSVACSPDYFVCIGGEAIPKQCPIGFIFDQVNLKCGPTAADCNFDCTKREDGMYGVGCSKHFWWCWNKMATRHECSAGLFFDVDNQECSYESTILLCGGTPRTTTQASAPVEVKQVVFDCIENGDHQHVAGECSGEFVSCSNGNAYARECPGGLVFDPETRFCDRRNQVAVCAGSDVAVPTFASPTSTSSNMCTGRQHGYKIATGPCSQSYIRCVDSAPMTVFCPDGQVYSAELGCDPPAWVGGCPEHAERIEAVTLEHIIIAQPSDAPIDSSSLCALMPDGDHALHEGLCRSTYISCSNGVTIMRDCPDGLVFNDFERFCDRTCDAVVMEPTTRQPLVHVVITDVRETIDASSECASMPDGDHAAQEGVCATGYITCSNGMTHMRDCPHDLVFNEASGFCDRTCDAPARMLSTAAPRAPTTSLSLPIEMSSECESMPDGDHALHEGECTTSYITCSNGVTHMRDCPHALVFNEEAGFCDRTCDAPIVVTNVRVLETTAAHVDVSTDCMGMADGDHGLSEGACDNMYMTCSNGWSHVRACPAGLVFNVAIGACDRSCEDEMTPVGPCANMLDGSKLEIDACQSMYWACESGLPVVRACVIGEVFSSRVGCALRSLVAECTSSSTRGPRVSSGFCATQPDGEYARAECSSSYYSCWLGETTEKECSEGKIFDSQFGTCTQREFVRSCSPATTTERATTVRPSTAQPRITPPPIRPTERVFVASTESRVFINQYGQRVEQDNGGSYNQAPPAPYAPTQGYVQAAPTQAYAQQAAPTNGYGPPLREPVSTGSYGQQAAVNYGGQQDPSSCAVRQQQVTNCMCVLAPGCQSACPNQGRAPPVPQHYGCERHSELAPCTEEFAFCQDGQTFPSWCEPGHVFNEFYQGCIHASEAPGCAAQAPPPSRQCAEGNARELDLCVDTFEACEFGQFVRKQCPPGTLFDTVHCIAPCTDGRCCPITYHEPIAEPESEPEVLLICHEQATSPAGPCHEQHYLCVNNAWTLEWCAPGSVYGIDHGQCVHPQDESTCELIVQDEVEVACIDNSRIAKSICSEEYFLCVHNDWTSAWCGEGGVFDPDSASCVAFHSLEVCAPARDPPQPICIDTSTSPAGPCHEQFYLCVSNAWTLAQCPGTDFYCPATQHCRPRFEIESCPQEQTYMSERPSFSPVCPSYGQASPYCLCAK